MSTDTAFALGLLALAAPRGRRACASFLLTLAVVDDLVALLVIATAYSEHVSLTALAVAIGLFGALVALRYAPVGRVPRLPPSWASAIWVAMFESGVAPDDRGPGHRPGHRAPTRRRAATSSAPARLSRSFREQPTPELARSAQLGVVSAISANERLQYRLHPWTSFAIVPLFALANAGIHVSGGAARRRAALADHARASSSATWSASRSGSSARRGSPPRARAASACRSAGPVLARRRRGRRHRLHGLAADREPRLPRPASSTRPRSASSPPRSSSALVGVGRLPRSSR